MTIHKLVYTIYFLYELNYLIQRVSIFRIDILYRVVVQLFSSHPSYSHPYSVWTLQSMDHVGELVEYPGMPTAFSHVKYTVVMSRKPLYVIMNLLLPCLTLSFLTLMVYVQPVTTGERCVYVITIVVTVCWYVVLQLIGILVNPPLFTSLEFILPLLRPEIISFYLLKSSPYPFSLPPTPSQPRT